MDPNLVILHLSEGLNLTREFPTELSGKPTASAAPLLVRPVQHGLGVIPWPYQTSSSRMQHGS
jgi:hypothetical protein